MIHVSVTGDRAVIEAFRDGASKIRKTVDAAVEQEAKDLVAFIRDELLSGQMLRIRTRKDKAIREHMRYLIRRTTDTVKADVHPKPNSPLWILGAGVRRRKILVTRRTTRAQRRAVRGRRYKRKLLRAMVGTYEREHGIRKIPFMEMALSMHRAEIRAAIEKAVAEGSAPIQAVGTGGP